MIEQNLAFVENRRQFYENHYRVSEPIDAWHEYAQNTVHSTTKRWFAQFGGKENARILNAGSGGSDYGIKIPMVHLDIMAEKISDCPEHIVGDVTAIPADDSSFDVILCVGSVINYANAADAICQFHRVLRPGGFLILEYERSNSPEYWWKHGFSAPSVLVDTFYGGVKTQLWAYSDQFVDGLLARNDFDSVKERRFHGLSSVVLAVTRSPHLASYFVLGDKLFANLPLIRALASNRMLAVKKLTTK